MLLLFTLLGAGWLAHALHLRRLDARLALLDDVQRSVVTLGDRLGALETRRRPAAPEPEVRPEPAPVRQPLVPTAPTPSPERLAKPSPAATPRPFPLPSPAAAPASASDAAASTALPGESLETRIGTRWLLNVGIAAIIVGVAYFEKLALDNHWISDAARIIEGVAVGLALVGGGLALVRRGYRTYGQTLSGAGVAILYVSTYAAFNVYHLIAHVTAFAAMAATTALAWGLADRQRSMALAVVGAAGGFATPFLLPAGAGAEAALFAYDAILVTGTLLMARRRDWPLLNVVSYGFAGCTVTTWALAFYTADKYLVTELFLTLFCGLFLVALLDARRSRRSYAAVVAAVLWTVVPLYYTASLFCLWTHPAANAVYLVLLAAIGVAVGTRTAGAVRLVFALLVIVPLAIWSDAHAGRWLVVGLTTWAATGTLHLMGLLRRLLDENRERVGTEDIALLHLNTLATFGGAWILLDPVHHAWVAPLAAILALSHGALGWAIHRRAPGGSLHVIATGFTLLTVAIALTFDGAALAMALGTEGAALLLGGLREGRGWVRLGGALVFAAGVIAGVTLLFEPALASHRPLLNARVACGTFLAALTYLLAVVHDRSGDSSGRLLAGVGLLAGNLLVLATTATEVTAYWSTHLAPTFQPEASVVAVALATGLGTAAMGLRRRQELLRWAGVAMTAISMQALLGLQMLPVDGRYTVGLNARAFAGLLAIVACYGLASMHRRSGSRYASVEATVAILNVGASLFTLSLLTSEIDAYWAARGAPAVWSTARESLLVITWAAIGSLLVWRAVEARRAWMTAVGGLVLGVALLRLFALELAGPGTGYTVIANARVLAALFTVATLYGLSLALRRASRAGWIGRGPHVALDMIANGLSLLLLTSEISAYWHVHDLTAAPGGTSHFARETMLSVCWAIYAAGLIVVGLWKRYAAIRYFGIAVFAITSVKVFAVDMAELQQIYRVLSVIGLGLALLVSSYVYNRAAGSRLRVGSDR